MNKIVLLLIATVLLLPGFLSLGIKVIPGKPQPSLGATEHIYSTSVVAEVFTAQSDGLGGIGTSLKNPNLQNKQNVVISLFDENGQLLRESIVNGASIPDGDFVKFLFKPVENSKDRNFVFVLSSIWSTEDDATEVFYSNDPTNESKLLAEKIPCLGKGDLEIMMVNPNRANDCTLLLVKNNQKANVSYTTFYKSNPLFTTKEVYLGVWNRLIADAPFLIIYLLIIVALIALYFYSKRFTH